MISSNAVGAEHQNRILAVVKSGNSSALISFSTHNYPPCHLSDLHISDVFPINETFFIDNASSGFGISSHQFQILSGKENLTFYFYPDDATFKSKDEFDRVIKKLIQGKYELVKTCF